MISVASYIFPHVVFTGSADVWSRASKGSHLSATVIRTKQGNQHKGLFHLILVPKLAFRARKRTGSVSFCLAYCVGVDTNTGDLKMKSYEKRAPRSSLERHWNLSSRRTQAFTSDLRGAPDQRYGPRLEGENLLTATPDSASPAAFPTQGDQPDAIHLTLADAVIQHLRAAQLRRQKTH